MSSADDSGNEDVISILLATDNHLGYCEKDPVRGNDSFIAFEEILELAVEKDVDFILLGGDLFHDAQPTQNSLHKCLKLLRQYTLGDRPISLEFVSDQSLAFHDAINQTVNYEDPNINVSIPVFSIHGNHDDPSGFGRLSSLNLLATTGLINYFGRWTDLTEVVIKPILLRKGDTQIALYGLSHIHDGRLIRLFQSGKVIMEQPDEDSGEWFNIMVIHQNRADRGLKNYIPEEILPEFLDLVLWGHEHDCRVEAEVNEKKNFYVTQPGSSVATSLAEGESLQKHVAVLHVLKKKFQIVPLPLKTVRPFVFESIDLKELNEDHGLDQADASEKVQSIVKNKLQEMIEQAKKLLTGHPKQPTIPLIRLRIVYNEEVQLFNAIRFGQQYNERVANPSDAIVFKKHIKKQKFGPKDFDKNAMANAFNEEADNETRVEDIVDRYFAEVDESKKLQIMNSKILSEMCFRLVEKSDMTAAETIVSLYQDKAISHLMTKLPSENAFEEEVQNFRDSGAETYNNVLKELDKQGTTKSVMKEDLDVLLRSPSPESPKPKATNRKSNKAVEKANEPKSARGSRRGRGGARGKGASNTSRTAQPLDISFGNSSKTPTLLDAISRKSDRSREASKIVYIIDSDSE